MGAALHLPFRSHLPAQRDHEDDHKRVANPMKRKLTPPNPAPEQTRAAATDDVDDAGTSSFPASDPPGWSTLRIGPPKERGKGPIPPSDQW
jgi:hypothetical protein